MTCIDLFRRFPFRARSRLRSRLPRAARGSRAARARNVRQPETNRAALDELCDAPCRRRGRYRWLRWLLCDRLYFGGNPALAAGFVDPNAPIIVDAISGITGAGRKPSARTHYCSGDESLEAYGLPLHRHQPEIALSYGRTLSGAHIPVVGDASVRPAPAHVIFTPHLAPLKRGILATVYLPLAKRR